MRPSYQILNTQNNLGPIMLFPTALRNLSLKSDRLVLCSDTSMAIFDNHIIYLDTAPRERRDITVVTESGQKLDSRTRLRNLVTVDGDSVSYVYPHIQAISPDLRIKDAYWK